MPHAAVYDAARRLKAEFIHPYSQQAFLSHIDHAVALAEVKGRAIKAANKSKESGQFKSKGMCGILAMSFLECMGNIDAYHAMVEQEGYIGKALGIRFILYCDDHGLSKVDMRYKASERYQMKRLTGHVRYAYCLDPWFEYKNNFGTEDPSKYSDIFLKEKGDTVYLLIVEQKYSMGTHVVSLIFSKEKVCFFDPNLGFFGFNRDDEGIKNMTSFIVNLFNGRYGLYGNYVFFSLMVFKPKSAKLADYSDPDELEV